MKKLVIPILLVVFGCVLFASTPNIPTGGRVITFTTGIFLLMSAMILFTNQNKGPYIKKIMLWLAGLLSIGFGPAVLTSNLAWSLVAILGIPLTILWINYFRYPPHLWKFVWLFRRKKQSEAAQYINEWIRTHPGNWKVYIMRSDFHLNRGQITEAERDSRMAIKLNPEYHEGYNQLGRSLMIMGQYEEAKQAFQTAQKLKPNSGYLANFGIICYMLGDYPAAAQALTQATRTPLDHPFYTLGANYYLGRSLENIGEQKRAQEAFKTMKLYATDINQYIAQLNEAPDFPGTLVSRTDFMDIKRRLNL